MYQNSGQSKSGIASAMNYTRNVEQFEAEALGNWITNNPGPLAKIFSKLSHQQIKQKASEFGWPCDGTFQQQMQHGSTDSSFTVYYAGNSDQAWLIKKNTELSAATTAHVESNVDISDAPAASPRA